MLTNSSVAGVPLVIVAGQQDYRHIAEDPLLSGNLTGLAGSLVRWAHEVRSRDELGAMARRAFRTAAAAPAGPVFLGLPVHLLDEVGTPPPSASRVDHMAAGAPRSGSWC